MSFKTLEEQKQKIEQRLKQLKPFAFRSTKKHLKFKQEYNALKKVREQIEHQIVSKELKNTKNVSSRKPYPRLKKKQLNKKPFIMFTETRNKLDERIRATQFNTKVRRRAYIRKEREQVEHHVSGRKLHINQKQKKLSISKKDREFWQQHEKSPLNLRHILRGYKKIFFLDEIKKKSHRFVEYNQFRNTSKIKSEKYLDKIKKQHSIREKKSRTPENRNKLRKISLQKNRESKYNEPTYVTPKIHFLEEIDIDDLQKDNKCECDLTKTKKRHHHQTRKSHRPVK